MRSGRLLPLLLPLLARGGFEKLVADLQRRRSELEVIVAMTTTPKRLASGAVEVVLQSVFEQSLQADRVVLALPRGPLARKPAHRYPEDTELPLFLKEPRRRLFVDRGCEDVGPGTAIICTLRHATKPDALIIYLPDDQILHKDHMAVLAWYALHPSYRGAAVATTALHSMPEFRPCLDEPTWLEGCTGRVFTGQTMGPITLGWLGVVVRPWFFGPTWRFEAADLAVWPVECRLHDDLWLASVLARRGIRRVGYNGGATGSEVEEVGRTDDALFHGNRWNLHVCNQALLARWPTLWHPRPRLVGLGRASREAEAKRCLRHLDEWVEVPLDTLQDRGWLDALSHEGDGTVVVAFPGTSARGPRCSDTSSAVQCATQRPDEVCWSGANWSTAEVAAGSAGAWTAAGSSRAPRRLGRGGGRCWRSLPGASWGHCCWPYGDDPLPAELLQAMPRAAPGCPELSMGCCDVHPRLSRKWALHEGWWDVAFDDGTQEQWEISEDGVVRSRDPAASPPGVVLAQWQMEGLGPSSMAQLRPLLAGGQSNATLAVPAERCSAALLAEPLRVLLFAHGEVTAVEAAVGGGRRSGIGTRAACDGCA